MAKNRFFVLFNLVLLISFQALPNAKKSRFEQLELFNKVIYLIESSYYRKVDTQKLIQGAIKGMMETLDPHSTYLSQEHYKKMQDETKGEFAGLGIEVTTKDGIIYVIAPIDDTPAFKAGLLPGDKIVDIDGESTLGLTLNESVSKMRGAPNSKVSLGVVREGVPGVKRFNLRRKIISVKPVKFELVSKNFAYIRLTQFSKKASSSISASLLKLKRKAKKKGGLKGIVLDLRNNPGGLLDEAINVSSIFLKEGVVVSTEGRDPKNKEIKYVNKSISKDLDTPLAILINGASASASEIVAGAIQDYKRGIILGSQSFGKGSVQQVAKIDANNGVKLTIAQYMTPKNRKIQALGITPDILLDDIDGEEFIKNKKNLNYVREIDLRNHLISTIETAEEKKLRLKRESEAKKQRVEQMKEIHNKKESKKVVNRFNPKKDFQVMMAINHLKAIEVLKTKN